MVYRFYCMALFHSQTRRHMINIYTNMHGISKKVMENNVVSDKLKVSHRLTSGGTFVAYIVHPMCSDSVFISKLQSLNAFNEVACLTDVGLKGLNQYMLSTVLTCTCLRKKRTQLLKSKVYDFQDTIPSFKYTEILEKITQ